MTGFQATEAAKALVEQYPEPETLLENLRSMNQGERLSFLRLWVTEGIPRALQTAPIFYDALRNFLAVRFEVNTKEITVIGSARMGYSLAPLPEFGRKFQPGQSDLDLSIISGACFSRLVESFHKWKEEYENEIAIPSEPEQRYWKENYANVPHNINRGFIDYNKIPYKTKYGYVMRVQAALYALKYKLADTKEVPAFRQVSARFFEDWDALFRQSLVNLNYAISRDNG